VLIDVNVGLPRCGCDPADAGRLADRARRAGLRVRGVMGYEGHAVLLPDGAARRSLVADAMTMLRTAHAAVGGDVISAGGTGSYDLNTVATEIQAGSYALMDTAYAKLGLPFREALVVLGTVVSVSPQGYAVADVGLKALGMDHGPSVVEEGDVWFFSDEHVTFAPKRPLRPGDRIRVRPAHVDPTMAYHERVHVVDGERVVETWPIDLRGW
jgi:D-serine deaminase-like pyridoxal phosphate-dependent protein